MGHNFFHLLNLSLFGCHWCKYDFLHIFTKSKDVSFCVKWASALQTSLLVFIGYWLGDHFFFLFLFYAVMVYMIE